VRMNGHLHGTSGAFRGGRVVALVFVVLALMTATAAGLLSAPAQASESVDYDAEEVAFVNLLNEYRVKNGSDALLVSDKLSLAAQRHSSDMGTYDFFDHTTKRSSWFPAGSEFNDRIAAVGYGYNTCLGENIAAGYFASQGAMDGFKASREHNDCMLNPSYRVVGIGRVWVKPKESDDYGWFWTVDFGGYVDPSAHALGSYKPGMYDQTNRRISYVGSWGGAPTFWWTNSSGAGAIITFTGTSIDLYSPKGPGFGKAEVCIDGGKTWTVDFSAGSYKSRARVFSKAGLAYGEHTLTMKCITEGRAIALDAVGIMKDSTNGGDLLTAPKPRLYQQGASALDYSGDWVKTRTWQASGGSFYSVDARGSTITVTFKGYNLVWLARTTPWYGRARVVLDGEVLDKRVDLHSWWTRYKVPVYDTGLLDFGWHTVEFKWTGSKYKYSWGTSISADAFKVTYRLE